MKKLFFYVLSLTLVFGFFACDDEESDVPEYVGDWETEAYLNAEIPAYQKILFDFNESSFESTVQVGTATALGDFMGVKGSLVKVDTADILIVSISDMGFVVGNGINYVNRESQAQNFMALFDTTLNGQIPLDFNAYYTVFGNQMDLEVEVEHPQYGKVVVDTLHLYKR